MGHYVKSADGYEVKVPSQGQVDYGTVAGSLGLASFLGINAGNLLGGVGKLITNAALDLTDLYKLAMSNGAPVIGIFNSNGTDIFAGTAGLAAYGKIMASVSAASGVIPQIALVTGKCIGLSAAIAAMMSAEGVPAGSYTVKSVKRAREARPAWAMAGMQQNTRPF